jgi:dihydroxyacetone kinase DhaKLM complex PTS-EIIA-like component DhaM
MDHSPSTVLCDPLSGFSCILSSTRHQHGTITHLADLPPPSSQYLTVNERWRQVDSFVQRFWSPNDGFSSHHHASHELTYGEVTSLGVRQLAYEMGISDITAASSLDRGTVPWDTHRIHNDCQSSKEHNNDIIFFDLGSGVGRLVTQMYMDQPSRVTRSVGVELALNRHEIGERALEGIIQELYHNDGEFGSDGEDFGMLSSLSLPPPIELIHGDALTIDLSCATHVYMSSLCFPDEVLLALQEKLLQYPSIQVVAALNRLDLLAHGQNNDWREREVPIQMSWGPSTAKIYERSHLATLKECCKC